MTSDKKNAALLAEIFAARGLKHIVISPGSRNAPIVIAFAQHPSIEPLTIVDERSAGFFALGIAQQTGQTVAISCTSGTAALNYAPAIAEAYYQKVPLLVLTADRPACMIDQGDGQTIRQKNLYANYILKSYELTETIETEEDIKQASELINEAINLTLQPARGPVHINLPFEEPIYNQKENPGVTTQLIPPEVPAFRIDEKDINRLAERWNSFSKKLILVGMKGPDKDFDEILGKIAEDNSVVVLSETTSNLGCSSVSCIDRVVSTFSDQEAGDFTPGLLVTVGGNVVSKMVKAFLRKNKPAAHWNIDPVDFAMNTYQCLTDPVRMEPAVFFRELLPYTEKKESRFKKLWQERADRSEARHKTFFDHCDYSDLTVFDKLLRSIPGGSNLHLGNSTPVRYSQLFRPAGKFRYNSNRGTSGIDGTVSTAAGAAWITKKPTTLITGDLGFLYDSNALMNHHLSGNLRIIIINNGGGGIFRFIPGPDTTDQLESFFEAKHNWTAKYIARNFDVPYYYACNMDEMDKLLYEFYKPQENDRPAILEIQTPARKNAKILRGYFDFLKG